MIGTLIQFVKNIIPAQPLPEKKEARQAYDLWSNNYDHQPENLMLALDDEIFTKLLSRTDLQNKAIADIGCGTGRHWSKILAGSPSRLTGYDVSDGMLKQLKIKYPQADVKRIDDNLFSATEDGAFDLIISTLTIAHIVDIDEAVYHWCRILKDSGDLILTDFHPDALALGGRRTFNHGKQRVLIVNHIHSLNELKMKFAKHGFVMLSQEIRNVDQSVKDHYLKQNALAVYEKFEGVPIIYGMHFRKGNGLN